MTSIMKEIFRLIVMPPEPSKASQDAVERARESIERVKAASQSYQEKQKDNANVLGRVMRQLQNGH